MAMSMNKGCGELCKRTDGQGDRVRFAVFLPPWEAFPPVLDQITVRWRVTEAVWGTMVSFQLTPLSV